jgi:hypothetical protein
MVYKTKYLLLAFGLLLLNGCKTTSDLGLVATTPIVFVQLDSVEQINNRIEQMIQQGDSEALSKVVAVELAPSRLPISIHESNQPSFAVKANIVTLNQQASKTISSIANLGGLRYMYSEDHNDQVWASHYQLIGDLMFDFTLYIDKSSYRIIDWKQHPYHFSFMQMVVEVDDLMFELYDSSNYYAIMAYNRLTKTSMAYESGAASYQQFADAFKALPVELKTHKVIADLVAKVINITESNLDNRLAMEALLAEYHGHELFLNFYYYQQQNFTQAIDNILAIKDSWLTGSVAQQELINFLIASHRYEEAISQAQDLVKQLPDVTLSHIILLRVTLLAQQHEMTTKTLINIERRFDFNVTPKWLRTMGNASAYIASAEFARFSQQPLGSLQNP